MDLAFTEAACLSIWLQAGDDPQKGLPSGGQTNAVQSTSESALFSLFTSAIFLLLPLAQLSKHDVSRAARSAVQQCESRATERPEECGLVRVYVTLLKLQPPRSMGGFQAKEGTDQTFESVGWTDGWEGMDRARRGE